LVAGALDTVKTVSDVAASVATIVALLVGAFWAYWAFIRERTRWPRAELMLSVSHRVLSRDEVVVHTKLVVRNLGGPRIKVQQVRLDICQVKPVNDEVHAALDRAAQRPDEVALTEVEWPPLPRGRERRELGGQPKSPEIEPGETDEFCFDLVTPRGLETIYLYAHVKNSKHRGREFGWETTEFYDLNDAVEKKVEFGASKPAEPIRSRTGSPGKGPVGQKEPRPFEQQEPRPLDPPASPGSGQPEPKESS